MFRHLEEFAKRIKLSGTAEEYESFRYLRGVLDGYGYRTELLRHEAYISLPGRARILIGNEQPDCITHSFSRPSPQGGLTAPVIYAGAGRAEDFAAIDARGRIVLLEGIANPGASLRASRAGAVGQVHISPHEHIHEMCISSVWGSPSEAAREDLPTTTVISVRRDAGEALKARVLAGETVEATLHAEVDTAWRETPLLVAELMPESVPDAPFVMFSGHHDTWYFGVMDNGGANATMLEAARLLARERAGWRRGLRLCFWSGHSHGRYSGSAWYADTRWEELAARCAVHVNVDSTGARGNTVLTDALCSAELAGCAAEAIRIEGGQELAGLRMSRAGDQSFWGVGVPSMFMAMGEQPVAAADNVMAGVLGGGQRRGAGLGWWWHTPEDTLDKMDRELLLRDTRIYVHALARLLTAPRLPLDYARSAAALAAEIEKLEPGARPALDLSALRERAQRLGRLAEAIPPSADDEAVNRALMAVSRALVPMDYTAGDRFVHDPALPQNPWPVLDPVRQMVASEAGGDERRFRLVAARRACNRLGHALATALAALEAVTRPA
ncbi:MAG: M28 family peptidase [Rhodospirillales bacterium]|nr:M28 family peptidase [Rhodospirillales bacterium]